MSIDLPRPLPPGFPLEQVFPIVSSEVDQNVVCPGPTYAERSIYIVLRSRQVHASEGSVKPLAIERVEERARRELVTAPNCVSR